MTHQIKIHDRNYSSFDTKNILTTNNEKLDIRPFEQKLFTDDTFDINSENNEIKIVSSCVRSMQNIPGVLIISGNKTYGKKPNGCKSLYKCIPYNKCIPPFLVSYEIKHIGFSKVFVNLYVTFSFVEWKDKHPIGILTNVIGPINVLINFYEYQLYCKNLNVSIKKFHKEVVEKTTLTPYEILIENIKYTYPNIEDRTIMHIFTIDSETTKDYDDAVSIDILNDNTYKLSIYISNVAILIDALNLWESFTDRVSTIYLPDKKRSMIPIILSEEYCSLQENTNRIAFTMDVYVKNGDIINTEFRNCIINVSKNYHYEEKELLNDEKYRQIFKITKKLSVRYKYFNDIQSSHDVVAYLMILMNHNCAQNILKHHIGIFRSLIINNNNKIEIPTCVPQEVSTHINMRYTYSGEYINISELCCSDIIDRIRHMTLDLNAYIHITSPIRRLVDLLNMIKFQEIILGVNLSKEAYKFYEKWINKMEHINTSMKSARKIQNECSLLDICSNDETIIDKEHEGYIFNKSNRSDGTYKYDVFLLGLKMFTKISLRENIDDFRVKKIKLFLFNEEDNVYKKIKLQMLD